MDTFGIDDRLRQVYERSAPVVDEAAFEARLRRSTSISRNRRSAPKPRNRLRVAAYASIALVLVAAVAVGSFEAVKYLGEDRAIIVIGDDTTPTAQKPEANTWVLMSTDSSDSPSARFLSSAVYDPYSKRIILFGGSQSETIALNDTWAYDSASNVWTKLEPQGSPPTSYGHTLARDPESGKLVMFAGYGSGIGQTWAYDPRANSWTDMKPAGPTTPGRYGYAMAYDPGSGKMLMLGGMDRQRNALRGLWAYDPSANLWAEVEQPYGEFGGEFLASMLYDPGSKSIMLFSGERGPETSLRVYQYDSAAGHWTHSPPPVPSPSSRNGHSVVDDTGLGTVVMFGGLGLYGALNDTWCYDTGAREWLDLQPKTAPSARVSPVMVYDPTTSEIVLFGGGGEGSVLTPLGDTWVFYSPQKSSTIRNTDSFQLSLGPADEMIFAQAWLELAERAGLDAKSAKAYEFNLDFSANGTLVALNIIASDSSGRVIEASWEATGGSATQTVVVSATAAQGPEYPAGPVADDRIHSVLAAIDEVGPERIVAELADVGSAGRYALGTWVADAPTTDEPKFLWDGSTFQRLSTANTVQPPSPEYAWVPVSMFVLDDGEGSTATSSFQVTYAHFFIPTAP